MISLKKLYGDELLKLALILSLLKSDPSEYLERETQQLLTGLHISNGTDWATENEARTLITPRYIHPKSIDNVLLNYEQDLFQELNSLGRYSNLNTRMWNSRIHTYLVNNVATETQTVTNATSINTDEVNNDSISADDNVGQEIKISNEDSEGELAQAVVPAPDAVVTITPGFLVNRTEADVFAEIATRSFDVNEFLVDPTDMQIKTEKDDDILNVKVEKDSEDLYSDNAIDDFVSYFAGKSEKFALEDSESVFDQNMADLREYRELFNEYKDLRKDFEQLDAKDKHENLEQFLLENTPLDETDDFDLAPMFDEELVIDVKRERASTSFTSSSSSGVSEMDVVLSGRTSTPDVKIEPDEGHHSGDELTQEDMDLIDVLWKQDVDMGFCLDAPKLPDGESKLETKTEIEDIVKKDEEIQKVKALLLGEKEEDPWAGLSYTVDTETGEYVLQGELPSELVAGDSRFDLLEEALQLVGVADDTASNERTQAVEGGSSSSTMLHPAMARHAMPPHHPLAHYHNQSLMRSMSVEQRWQDLASLLTIPPPPDQYQHYHHHHQQHPHNISHGAATSYAPNYAPIAPPMAEKHHEAYGAAAPLDGAYKVESAHLPQQHDGVYYQPPPTEMAPAPASDGFLQSILNDEDLQLMDMAMNEGMYTMRILDGGAPTHHIPHQNHTTHMMMTTAERDSASDSAVSSMGSERVPSLSDGEWCDAGSDSPQEYHSSKFRPYEAAYRDRPTGSQPPQKKHHMFGKRCFQEPPVNTPGIVKYESPDPTIYHDLHSHHGEYRGPSITGPPLQPPLDLNHPHSSHAHIQSGVCMGRAPCERVRHNHTYAALPLTPGPDQRIHRDKRVRRLTEGSMSDAGSTTSGHLSRDEKRAKALGIPLEVHDIINLPMDEFNERLSKHDLSEAQLSLIRDIRRRGKNKVAAQNCRKRKLDQITHLADEVRTVRDRKARTQREHLTLTHQRHDIKERFAALYRHVFQNLRDPEGRPLSSSQYSLQQAADGNVVLVPKINHHNDPSMNRTSDEDMDRKAKSYDQ